MAVGACASSGGIFDTYSVLQGIDQVVPVDVYVPGCPPRPEAIIDGIIRVQDLVGKESLRRRTAHSIKDCWKATEYNKAKVFLEFLYALD
jgi:NADH-quinone oxidoreductase subunit B